MQRIGIPFFLWSVFYAIPSIIKGGFSEQWQFYVSQFITGYFNGYMWFFVPLAAFYLSIPFFDAFFRTASDRQVNLLVYFIFIFCVFLPFACDITGVELYSKRNAYITSFFPVGSNLLMYPILGYIIVKTNKFIIPVKTAVITLIATCLLHYSIRVLEMSMLQEGAKSIFNYTAPTCVILSFCVFTLFKHINWDKLIGFLHLSPTIIQQISSCSFGIYLIQAFVMHVSKHFELGLTNRYYGFLLIYLISLSVIWLMKKFPVVRIAVP